MRSLFALLLFAAFAQAEPPPPDSIELPPAPVPIVPPTPIGAAVKLTGTKVYDVRCKVPCVVRAYPASFVSITTEVVAAGETLRVKDDFSDGAKQHSYKGPMTVYSVKAAGTGAVTLVITPIGFKAEAEIVSVSLDVDAGQGPIPPPTPDDPFVNSLKIAFATETAAEQAYLPALKSLYAKGATLATDATLTTWGSIFAAMGKEAATTKVAGHLYKLQVPVAKYLETIAPAGDNSDTALTSDDRTKLKAAFLKIIAALEGVK